MKLIFENEIVLHPQDSKTNIFLPFETMEDYVMIEIHFSYRPKVLADIKLSLDLIEIGMDRYAPGHCRAGYGNLEDYLPVQNLLTLSLDSPAGYTGCAHRHNPDQKHILSEQFSSPGFTAQKPVRGNWQAVINAHAIVTDTCTCKLQIYAAGESGVLQ